MFQAIHSFGWQGLGLAKGKAKGECDSPFFFLKCAVIFRHHQINIFFPRLNSSFCLSSVYKESKSGHTDS